MKIYQGLKILEIIKGLASSSRWSVLSVSNKSMGTELFVIHYWWSVINQRPKLCGLLIKFIDTIEIIYLFPINTDMALTEDDTH